MSKVMQVSLQIYKIKQAIKKNYKDIADEVLDRIDFQAGIDRQLSYTENLSNILKYISKEVHADIPEDLHDELISDAQIEPSKSEMELEDFKEKLRIEFNLEGYDLGVEDFEELLYECANIFSKEEKVSSLSGSIHDPISPIIPIKDSNIKAIVELLKRKTLGQSNTITL